MSTSALRLQLLEHHYTHSVPSGKSWYYSYEDAIVVFAIPPNKNISRWLLGRDNAVLELARLWAPDGHKDNLLTQAIAHATKLLRAAAPVDALISYADPNVGHSGGVYRAASWVYLGQCEEGRYYRSANGQVVSRRAFHSGRRSMRKAEIEALGYAEMKMPGKHRFARGLTRSAKRAIEERAK